MWVLGIHFQAVPTGIQTVTSRGKGMHMFSIQEIELAACTTFYIIIIHAGYPSAPKQATPFTVVI